MNVSTAPGIEFSNSNPWHGGNSKGGQKKKEKRYFTHCCVRIPDNVNRHFGARTQLLSEHPNRRPSPNFLDMWKPRFQQCLALSFYDVKSLFLVWTGRVWYMLCVKWGWGADDTTRTTGCDFIKGKCVRKWVQSVLRPFWGKTAWTCIKFSNMQSPSLVLSHGWLCLLTAGSQTEFWTGLRLHSSTWHLSYCSDPGFPPSDTVLATRYGPSNSFSLWGSQICLGFIFLLKSYVLP